MKVNYKSDFDFLLRFHDGRGKTLGAAEYDWEVSVFADKSTTSYTARHSVNELIRERYTLSEELAVLRQRDTKPDEFEEYYNYAEQCKAEAKGGA